MKKLAILLTVLLSFAAVPAHAFETDVKDEKGKAILTRIGNDLAPMAAEFGCDKLAWANFMDKKGEITALQFLPKSSTMKNWTHMVSVVVYVLPNDPAKDVGQMYLITGKLLDGYKKNGKIVEQKVFENSKKEPAFYIEYNIGEGNNAQNNAGVFRRTSNMTAAFIQVQSRSGKLSDADKDKIKTLIHIKTANTGAVAKVAPAAKKPAAPAAAIPTVATIKQ